MRKYLAATAVLSSALLLAACSGSDQADDDTTPTSSPEATETAAATPAAIDTVETCAGYYDGGDLSVDHRVTTWGPALGDTLDDTAVVEVTVVRDRIASLLRYANEETTPLLQAIQVPFENALSGTAGDPAAVETAAGEFRTACEDAGFEF